MKARKRASEKNKGASTLKTQNLIEVNKRRGSGTSVKIS
jgi:hypothetical protein